MAKGKHGLWGQYFFLRSYLFPVRITYLVLPSDELFCIYVKIILNIAAVGWLIPSNLVF